MPSISVYENTFDGRAQFVTVWGLRFRVGPSGHELKVAAQDGYLKEMPKRFFPRPCLKSNITFPGAFSPEEILRMKNRAQHRQLGGMRNCIACGYFSTDTSATVQKLNHSAQPAPERHKNSPEPMPRGLSANFNSSWYGAGPASA